MSRYLLEIGTEELPYKFIPAGQQQIQNLFEKFFKENSIEFDNIKTYGTPRRLTIIISGLQDKQPDVKKTVKGPILNVAIDSDKKFTKAAEGFAARNGLSTNDLIVKDNYIWANIEQKGKDTKDLLKNNIEKMILSLQGPYFMRWAELDVKFQRPIRWIVSLYNNKELPISIAEVCSSIYSRGHRFVSDKVEITDIEKYEEILLSANVIVDTKKRKEKILSSAGELAKSIGAEVAFDDELVNEVTSINEWPVPVMCEFYEKYLKVPEKVIVTVMATHQRYFPVYKNGKLLNKFITMANYTGNDFNNIKAGNERVIKARLDDAIFFFNEDTKKPLNSYIESLKGMTFQKGMGSVYDKTERIVILSKYLLNETGIVSESVLRTAQLCKADLATQLVFEFTELQGFIGADYALISGESAKVAQGIKEHYFPLNANSELPVSLEGQIVSIADKIDTICAVFASGKKPTGSQDPLGVRRAVLGILKTVIQKNININIDKLIDKTLELLPAKINDKITLKKNIVEFFEQRLAIYYAEFAQNDVLTACISGKNVLSDLKDFTKRVSVVVDMKKLIGFNSFNEGANRILRILKDKNTTVVPVDTKLFVNEYERNLYEKIVPLISFKDDYDKLVEKLIALSPQISEFFDNVLVMDENEKIKQNRINMLFQLKDLFSRIADFSKLSA